LEENVARFAALGIPEYFVFDRAKRRILGHRLPPAGSVYEPIVPQQGRWRSAVLGLELGVEESRLRFYVGSAVVPEASELVERANQLSDRLQDKMAELERELQRPASAPSRRMAVPSRRKSAPGRRRSAPSSSNDSERSPNVA